MTQNRNYLSNGRFLDNLNNWTLSDATYLASDGSDHFGVAVLPDDGDYLEQSFTVPRTRLYTLAYSFKAPNGWVGDGDMTIILYDSAGTVVTTVSPTSPSDTWTAFTASLGLIAGENYTVRFNHASDTLGDISIDDVWLWAVPISRASVAAIVHDRLGALATDKSLSVTASGDLTEGDYTYSVDAGLRRIGAVDPETAKPDVRYLEVEDIEELIAMTLKAILEQLQVEYASEVDISVGPRRESLSQVSKAIGSLLSSEGGAGGSIVVRSLKHE